MATLSMRWFVTLLAVRGVLACDLLSRLVTVYLVKRDAKAQPISRQSTS